MRQRKFQAARDILGPALMKTPLPLGYCLLGDAEVALHDDEAARRSYQCAIDLAGDGAGDGVAAIGVARCDARLGKHRAASRQLRKAVSRRSIGLAPNTAAAASLEAASASVRAGDCDVAARWLGAVLRCDSRRLALDERDRSNALALLTLLQLRSGDLDVDAAGRALADCRGASLLGRVAARQIPRGGEADLVTGQGWDDERWRLERVALNANCLHSPAWAALDDKLGLHRALGRWQRGGGATAPPWHLPSFELPQEREGLMAWEEKEADEADVEAPQWVLKSPRGYGGGGIRFLQRARDLPPDANGLVQRYVSPPLLLKGGRRATLRAYVIVLTSQSSTRAFLSRDGLVRFAARAYDGRAEDLGQHLTNGAQAALALDGEGEGSHTSDFADESFEWLEGELGGDAFSRVTWPRVLDAASTLVALAAEEEPSSAPLWPHTVLPLSMPKILGLDFSIGAGGVPYLLELNRTPGLVPRGNADSAVKEAVVDAAWSLWRGAAADEDLALDRLVELR